MSFRECLAAIWVGALSGACGTSVPSNPTGPSSSAPPAVSPAPPPAGAATHVLNGVYDVRFEADSGCSDVPETARIRQYTAHADGSFLITLTGAQFGPPFQPGYDWNVMYQNEHDGTFSLFFQDPEIWELLTPDSYVSIFGDGHGVVTDRDHIELDAWANVSFCPQREEDDPYPECAVTEIVCRSDHLKVTLTRH